MALSPGVESDNRTITRRLADLYNVCRKDYYVRGQYLEALKPETEIKINELDLSGLPSVGYEASMNMDDPDTTLYFPSASF